MPDAAMPASAKAAMRRSMQASSNAYQAADADKNATLDFAEFCTMAANKGTPADELRRRFDAADADGSGAIDRAEYLALALTEALAASKTELLTLFEDMDKSKTGVVRASLLPSASPP